MLHPPQETVHSRRLLLGSPLLLVAAFCFGWVLMQTHSHPTGASISSSHTANKIAGQSELSSDLAPVSSASQTKIDTSSSASSTSSSTDNQNPASSSSSVKSSSVSSSTTNPQLSKSSDSVQATASLSEGGQNSNKKDASKPLNVVKKLFHKL